MEESFGDFVLFVRRLLDTVGYQLEVNDRGRKYYKLIMDKGSQKSVWCFVDKETGEIFKPVTWKAPARHSRGNVLNPESYRDYVWTGPPYLR